MQRMLTTVLLCCLFLQPTTLLAEDGKLSDTQRGQLVELFERSRAELEKLAAHATGEHWAWKPAADRWSVGEVVEHIVLAEEGLFAMIQGALAGDPDPDWQKFAAVKITDMVTMLQDRSQKFPAPEPFVPSGEASRSELLERYAKIRMTVLDFVRTTDAALDHYTGDAPAGKSNARQFLGLLAGHNLRHNQQIVEVLEAMHEHQHASGHEH